MEARKLGEGFCERFYQEKGVFALGEIGMGGGGRGAGAGGGRTRKSAADI